MGRAPTTTPTPTPAATAYGFHCAIDAKEFVKAVAHVTDALKTEDFGVPSEIDVRAAMEARGAHEIHEQLRRGQALRTAPSTTGPRS